MKTPTLVKILGLSALCAMALNTARAEDTENGSDQNSKRALTEARPGAQHEGGKGCKNGERKAKMLARFDKNGDGKLDDTEKAAAKTAMKEHRKARLAKFDKNGDGKLDGDEKAAAKAAMKEHHKHHKDGGGSPTGSSGQ